MKLNFIAEIKQTLQKGHSTLFRLTCSDEVNAFEHLAAGISTPFTEYERQKVSFWQPYCAGVDPGIPWPDRSMIDTSKIKWKTRGYYWIEYSPDQEDRGHFFYSIKHHTIYLDEKIRAMCYYNTLGEETVRKMLADHFITTTVPKIVQITDWNFTAE